MRLWGCWVVRGLWVYDLFFFLDLGVKYRDLRVSGIIGFEDCKLLDFQYVEFWGSGFDGFRF